MEDRREVLKLEMKKRCLKSTGFFPAAEDVCNNLLLSFMEGEKKTFSLNEEGVVDGRKALRRLNCTN